MEEEQPVPVVKKISNDIREIRTIRQLNRVNLDFESPRILKAMDNLGVSLKECQKMYFISLI